MIFFFGTRSRTVNGNTISGGVECPTCGHNEFQTFGHQHYFHLYWIPTFPTGRTVGLECTHCHHTLADDEMPESLASHVTTAVFGGVSRLPMFAGLLLIGLLVLYGGYTAAQVEASHEAVLEQPAAGDYYVVDLTKIDAQADAELPFTVWRVSEVTDEYVRVDESAFVYEYWSDASSDVRDGTAAGEIDSDGEGIFIDLDQLATWRDEGAFKRALRP